MSEVGTCELHCGLPWSSGCTFSNFVVEVVLMISPKEDKDTLIHGGKKNIPSEAHLAQYFIHHVCDP